MFEGSHCIKGSKYIRCGKGRYEIATPQIILEEARRIVDTRFVRGTAFGDSKIASSFFLDKLSGLEREVFAAVFLDTRHKLIAYEELFLGTIDGAEVYPRELVRKALACNAAAVIVAHNHPSSDLEPSSTDRVVTGRMK